MPSLSVECQTIAMVKNERARRELRWAKNWIGESSEAEEGIGWRLGFDYKLFEGNHENFKYYTGLSK